MAATLPDASDTRLQAEDRMLRRARRGEPSSAGFAVGGVPAAARAVLLQVEPVGVVAPVLLGDVVALFALRAGHGDLRTDVSALGGHGVPLDGPWKGSCKPDNCSRPGGRPPNG